MWADKHVQNDNIIQKAEENILEKFYVLLTVQHLDAILGNDQPDALFLNVFICYASTCFEQQVLIIRRTILY
jgi:hypothetical protein